MRNKDKLNADDFENLLKSNGYKDLGWQNEWEKVPIEREKCIDLGHKLDDIRHNIRGSDNTISCDICKIFYKLDRGD